MLTVSDAFKTAILPGTTQMRRTAARVTLTVSEATIEYDTVTVLNDESAFSDSSQVVNGVADSMYRIATCEPDFCLLDGSTIVVPIPAAEIGYISDEISDIDGLFSANPAVVITTVSAFSSKGLTLYFDRLSGDYPIEFDVDIDDSGTSTNVYHLSVTDNTKSYYLIDADINAALDPCDTITITFKKMNRGYRRARMTELFMGVQQTYGESSDDMISITTIAEIDPTVMTLPHGTTTLKLSNINGDFNLLNPAGLALYLHEPGAKMETEIGVYLADGTIEFVKTRTDIFTDWKDAGSKIVDLNAIDTLGFYGGIKVTNLDPSWTGNESPRDYLAGLIDNLQLPVGTIDDAELPVSDYDFLSGQAEETLLDELRSLAQYLCKICKVDSGGIIRFVDLSDTTSGDILLDDCYDDPTIDRSNVVGGVDVSIYSPTLAVASEVISTYTEAITGQQYVYIQIGQNWGDLATEVTGATSVSIAPIAHGVVVVDVTGDGSLVTIETSGKPISIATAKYSLNNPDALDPTLNRINVDNKHIYTTSKAATVAAYVLANCGLALKFKVNWRGNPIIETGDMWTMETIHGYPDTLITRQDLTFDGTLSGSIEGVG